jgi:hypothetical protein
LEAIEAKKVSHTAAADLCALPSGFLDALDFNPYFGNYRTMERAVLFSDEEQQTVVASSSLVQRRQASEMHSVLTQAVLAELKRQASPGCVLCSLDDSDEEDWD